ncbi:TraR/DksA C4-type zinc finger protein [Aquibacillus koreensis]|uniref:TraR/DksA C4-type zinc finger protein n=1 Tax=Aquibacillus koreensis TaxID=279446 RepID=A0A9X3WIN1_9BACI|nr:TraR/DksA C4-type zinc finger protein [Aquibacillus koreensis]MCT2536011.1 TraR/DksA C4-type zinc finger protein [Aquibacillus koreensis]MDC3420467.1 TraR/DksA C4-type zinc finger protein [Aquibacillus koreensis]
MVSTTVVNKAEEILLQEKKETTESLNRSFVNNDATGELSNYDNHPGDQGTELFDQEKDNALHSHEKQKLNEINQSLRSIEEGTYGTCEICGKEINEERLLTIPTTSRCRNHAVGGMNRERPVEEDIVKPDLYQRERSESNEINGFDGKDTWQALEEYGSSETPSDFYEKQDRYDSMYMDSDESDSPEEIEEVAKSGMRGKKRE